MDTKRYMNWKWYSTCLVGVGGREDIGAVVLVQRLGRAPVEDALAPSGAVGLGQAADLKCASKQGQPRPGVKEATLAGAAPLKQLRRPRQRRQPMR